MKRTYRFAERLVCIDSIYTSIHDQCKEYVTTDSECDFKIETSMQDIDFERQKSAHEDEIEGKPIRNFTEEYLETLAVYRKIAERMPEYDTMLFHGSCVAVEGKGYLFTAKSGTGKSTHTRLWRELFGKRAVMVNDDKPLIRVTEERTEVFGTPWDGKHRLSTNVVVPLKALCILERAEKNEIHQISAKEAYPILLQQVYRPCDSKALIKTLALLEKMTGLISIWKLGCNMDIEAAQLSYNAMKE